ncbi:restriction endonuclease subunit S [Pseudomonas corrugata]|nr:restriction endonuclease subunit S [Pseudomonas corrugata]
MPTGWTIFSIADLGGVSGGKTPSKANPHFWLSRDVPWVSPKDMKKNVLNDAADWISQLAISQAGMTLYPANSVLMVTRSGILQHTFPVALAAVQLTVNQDIKVFRPAEGVVPKFFFYMLRSFGTDILSACSKDGTTVQSIDSEKLEAFPLPLPPLLEQTRIAAKLDELLAQVDTLKARIDGIPALLKRFRQSVLAAAVSGKLTEEWRAKKAPEGTTSPNNDWKTIRIDQACADEKYSLAIGPFGSNLKVSDYRDDGKPLVFVREIRAGCFGDKKTKFITPEKFDELSAHQISAGDILVTKMGDPPGDVAIYPATAPDAVITADCIKLRVNESVILREYAYYQMKSNFFRQKVQEISAGVAQQKVSLGNFREITLLVPSREEQREIVRHVGELLAFADQLEVRVKAAQVRIDGLTQSILAKAFRGELVPQDPNDEPAGFLLERIKAQRATAPKTKRGRQAATLG